MPCNDHEPTAEPRFEIGKWYILEDHPTGEDTPMYGSQIKWSSELDRCVGNVYQVHSTFYNNKHGFMSGIKGNVAVHISWVRGPYESRKEAEMASKIKIACKQDDNLLIDQVVGLDLKYPTILNSWEKKFLDSIDSIYRNRLSIKQRNKLAQICRKFPEAAEKQLQIEVLKGPDFSDYEDVKYFQKKLANALKVPKEYLNKPVDGEVLIHNGSEWMAGNPTTSGEVKVRAIDGSMVKLPAGGSIQVKTKHWQKETKKMVNGSFDYQKYHQNNNTPYVQGELISMKNEGDKIVTGWKDPQTGLVTEFEQDRAKMPWEPGYIAPVEEANQNPCTELTLYQGGEHMVEPEPEELDVRWNPMDDSDDFFVEPIRELPLNRKIEELEYAFRQDVYKREAERNLRDQKRELRRNREAERLAVYAAKPAPRKTRWGWIAAAILTVSGIAGAWYAGLTPDLTQAQEFVVERYEGILGR